MIPLSKRLQNQLLMALLFALTISVLGVVFIMCFRKMTMQNIDATRTMVNIAYSLPSDVLQESPILEKFVSTAGMTLAT